MPLVDKIPNVPRFESGRVAATTDGSERPYQRIAEFWFEDEEQMQSSLGSEEGQAAANDLPNFATGGVTNFISQVEA